jgi:hypothetical protein
MNQRMVPTGNGVDEVKQMNDFTTTTTESSDARNGVSKYITTGSSFGM